MFTIKPTSRQQERNITETTPRAIIIAAAAIFLAAGFAFYFMPPVVLWLGAYSPWLGAGAGALMVLAFFGVFWLRAMFQRRR